MNKFGMSCACAAFCALSYSTSATAVPDDGNQPIGSATEVGRWFDWSGAYADVWGDGDYAYVAHFGDAGVHIIDISDPATPFVVAHVRADPPNDFASAQDVKVGDGLLFIALESNPNDGVLIVDVRDPTNPIKLTLVDLVGFSSVHNVFYDSGFLYLVGGSNEIAIVDLTEFDPNDAPEKISEALWVLTEIGSQFVHDMTVQNGRLYACAWSSGLWVYDVTNVGNALPTLLGTAPGQSTHSAWPTDDGKFVVTGEERVAGGIKVFEIEESEGLLAFTLRDQLVLPLGETISTHNQIVVGYRVFNSWYQAGLWVLDIDPITGKLVPFADFDTFGGSVSGFNGAWGVYPLLGQDRVLVTDISNGFFIIDVAELATLSTVEDFPKSVHPKVPTPMAVQVTENDEVISEVTLNVIGPPALILPMKDVGGGRYEGSLPRAPCGEPLSFYVNAQTQRGRELMLPTGAPDEKFYLETLSARIEIFHDSFESDLGWTIGVPDDKAADGLWTRGDPVGTTAQPEDDNPLGVGTVCMFTGQGSRLSANPNRDDVDDGSTTIVSPIIAPAGTTDDLFVEFAIWFSNELGDSPGTDPFEIWFSNDAGGSWTLFESLQLGSTTWEQRRIPLEAFGQATDTMQWQFVASDTGPDSLVEAALDEFVLARIVCSEKTGDVNGDAFVTLNEYGEFYVCHSGPGAQSPSECVFHDGDYSGTVDMRDVASLWAAFTGGM